MPPEPSPPLADAVGSVDSFEAAGPGHAPGAVVPESVTVVLAGRRTAIPYRAGDTLLETARRGGLSPPFSCEAGNCATCMARLTEGAATMRVNDALDDDDIDEGWVLTCQAVPHGPTVTVDYQAF